MNAKSIRIKDIAQLAGVSVGTVDRVLHNRGRVSEDALKKVLGVLDQIDYKPNLIARTLGANKTYRIAALMPNPEQDPYWASSKSGLSQAEAEWLRYGVKVEPYYFNLYDKSSFKEVAESVGEANPDGILVAPIFYFEALPFFEIFRSRGIPYVLFNTNIPEAHPMCFIGQDLHQSGKVGGELMHLSLCGSFGTIIVIHINEDLGNSVHLAEKEKGFREYFESRSLPYEIRTLNLNDPSKPGVEKEIQQVLQNTAVRGIFVSTSKGTSVIAAFLEKYAATGIKLVGYDMLQDNIRYMKKGIVNFLINQNPRKQAFHGLNQLVGNLILKKDTPEKDLLPLEIISQANLESYLNAENH
jgi:LacI family transcriptional regulator